MINKNILTGAIFSVLFYVSQSYAQVDIDRLISYMQSNGNKKGNVYEVSKTDTTKNPALTLTVILNQIITKKDTTNTIEVKLSETAIADIKDEYHILDINSRQKSNKADGAADYAELNRYKGNEKSRTFILGLNAAEALYKWIISKFLPE